MTAPVEVKKVPVDAEKLFEPEPEAVKPLVMIGVVSVHEVVEDAPVKVLAASVLATVMAASGKVIVLAVDPPVVKVSGAVAPANGIEYLVVDGER